MTHIVSKLLRILIIELTEYIIITLSSIFCTKKPAAIWKVSSTCLLILHDRVGLWPWVLRSVGKHASWSQYIHGQFRPTHIWRLRCRQMLCEHDEDAARALCDVISATCAGFEAHVLITCGHANISIHRQYRKLRKHHTRAANRRFYRTLNWPNSRFWSASTSTVKCLLLL